MSFQPPAGSPSGAHDHTLNRGRDHQSLSAPAGPEPIDLGDLDEALMHLADNPSMRHQAPTLAAMQIEIRRVLRLSDPGPNRGQSVGESFDSASESATQRMMGGGQ